MAHEVNPVKKDAMAGHGLSAEVSANLASDPGTSPTVPALSSAATTPASSVVPNSDLASEVVQQELVERVGRDRIELWMPATTAWIIDDTGLSIEFESEFACQLAKKMLGNELANHLREIVGKSAELHLVAKTSQASPTSKSDIESRRDSELHSGASLANRSSQSSPTAGKSINVSSQANRESATTARQSASLRDATLRDASPHDASSHGATMPSGSSQLSASIREAAVASQANRIAASAAATAGVRTIPMSSVRDASLGTSARPEQDSWKQFVAGECNQLAWATAKLVVSEPGGMTPVLFHGPSGVGKSLLAKAIAEQLRTVRRLPRVVHMSSEQFLNEFTDGLRGGGLPMFRRKYRDVEALILEDIQFFVGKKSSLAEVKHTLDNLLRLGKQVVFVADRSLNELQGLGNDLVARLRGGLTIPVFPLDEKTRATILRRDLKASGLQIAEDVVDQIAGHVTGDGRVLSGIVKRLAATAAVESARRELFGKELSAASTNTVSPAEGTGELQASEPTSALDWDCCWSAISDLVQATKPIVRIVDIDRAVCNMFGLEPETLQSESKIRRVSQPRMLAMFLARKYTPAAYKEIGQYFGRRRHSTVISAEKTVESWLHENSDLDVGPGLKVRDAIRHVESQLQVC